MYGHREHLKLIYYFDAIYLDREGYWGCIKCHSHNPDRNPFCMVCGAVCWKRNMPTELLSPGLQITLLQNVVYALPTSKCLLFCDTAATLQQSNTFAFTNSVALTLVDGQTEVAGGFIRSTAGNALVSLKKA